MNRMTALQAQNSIGRTIYGNRVYENRYNGLDRNAISERRIQTNRLRRKREMQKNFFLTLMTICFAMTLAFSVNVILSNAKDQDEPVYYKYYSSIVVESGDTLWSIAREHMGSQYETTSDYVKEVMQMNSLTNDKIVAGQHLVIPYYSAQFME
ncbi:MAG: LysM peptidoglycan-binding domain-containing protein [Lachnospiraceae bacterium]|nr:LysM peptidoglycan-binding domain-containing protein [Lachnospiraceae bacterium]